jgi:hypothetical protein
VQYAIGVDFRERLLAPVEAAALLANPKRLFVDWPRVALLGIQE